MTYRIQEAIPNPADAVLRGLEAIVQVILITEIVVLVLIVGLLIMFVCVCYRELTKDGRRPVAINANQEGRLIQLSDWSKRRLKRCGRLSSDCVETSHEG